MGDLEDIDLDDKDEPAKPEGTATIDMPEPKTTGKIVLENEKSPIRS